MATTESSNPSNVEYLKVATDLPCGPNAFAMRVAGNSMAPHFLHGEVAIADPDERSATAGDFVALFWRELGLTKPAGMPELVQLVTNLPPWCDMSCPHHEANMSNDDVEAVVIVRQFNPPRQRVARLERVYRIVKVIGKADGPMTH